MPKITRENGPTYEGQPTPADVLRERGKLGPYAEETDVTLQICAECGTACAADLEACPHCQGTDLAEEGADTEAAPVETAESEAEGDVVDNDVEPDAEPADATTPRPATSAPKGEWLAYAEDLTGEDCSGLTKTELQEFVDAYDQG